MYLYEGIGFDSSWELIFYLYYKNQDDNIKRLEMSKYFYYEFENKKCKWFPDFMMNGIYYEIKPDSRRWKYKDYEKQCIAKQKSHPEIIWVGDKEIVKMRKHLKSLGIDVKQYRQN
jgi:hypothetical protein